VTKLEYKKAEKALVDALQRLNRTRDLIEVQNAFLILYTFRYLSSGLHNLSIPKKCTVEGLLERGQKDIDAHLMLAMQKLDEVSPEVFNDWSNSIDFQSRIWGVGDQWKDWLYRTLETLKGINFELLYEENNSVFSDLFNFLLEYFSEEIGKKAGEFYSPPEVGEIIVEILSPGPRESIYDPVCGSGGFLSLAAKYIEKKHDFKNVGMIVGQEKNINTSLVAKLNLIIHGYHCFNISTGDTLLDPHNRNKNGGFNKFDTVLANPPFSLKSWWNESYSMISDDSRYKLGLPPKSNADYAFILHVIASMSDGGNAGVVVSSGALFRGGVEERIREKIVKEGLVDAVISLPSNLFYGTSIPANILILNKRKNNDKVLFIEASNCFFVDGRKNKLSKQHVDEIIDLYKNKNNIEGRARYVEVSELAANAYNLSVSKYIIVDEKKDDKPLTEIINRQRELENELDYLQKKMREFTDNIL
jgi:type I restriction enzyme M protein